MDFGVSGRSGVVITESVLAKLVGMASGALLTVTGRYRFLDCHTWNKYHTLNTIKDTSNFDNCEILVCRRERIFSLQPH